MHKLSWSPCSVAPIWGTQRQQPGQRNSLWVWGGPCRVPGNTPLHKRSNAAELRDGAQGAGKAGTSRLEAGLQMTNVKWGDSNGWDVLKEGNLHDLGWRQRQKEARRFGDGQSQTQLVLPGWPIEVRWLDWMCLVKIPTCKTATQVK